MPRESAAADGHDREGDARNNSDSESGTSSTTSEEDWSDVDEEGTQGIVTPVDMGGDVYIAISFNRGENFHSLKPSVEQNGSSSRCIAPWRQPISNSCRLPCRLATAAALCGCV